MDSSLPSFEPSSTFHSIDCEAANQTSPRILVPFYDCSGPIQLLAALPVACSIFEKLLAAQHRKGMLHFLFGASDSLGMDERASERSTDRTNERAPPSSSQRILPRADRLWPPFIRTGDWLRLEPNSSGFSNHSSAQEIGKPATIHPHRRLAMNRTEQLRLQQPLIRIGNWQTSNHSSAQEIGKPSNETIPLRTNEPFPSERTNQRLPPNPRTNKPLQRTMKLML
jgi:hypothetical protein